MFNYLVRRVALGLLTLLLITLLIFALLKLMPGSPLTTDPMFMNPGRQPSPQQIEMRMKLYGLDKPWYVQYFVWLGNVVRLDLGRSIPQNNKPVAQLIRERVPATLMLSLTSLALSYLLSVPIGLWVTVRSGTMRERTVSTVLYMLYSLPSFVAALYLQLLFFSKLGWLPLFGMTSDNYTELSTAGKAWDILKHSILPVICFTYGSLAYYSRFVQANMQEVVRQDYIRTARAKGVSPGQVIWHHAFRNTLIPFVTLLGLTLPSLLGGAVILEQIFGWPGMGRLFFDAISQRDTDTVMGLTLMFSFLTLAGQLLADILYAFVDPRVAYK